MMTEETIKKYLDQPYSRMLIPDEDGRFFAQVLEMPGCLADGDSPSDAFHRLNESMEAWIETALEEGIEIPEPLAAQGYSGRLVLRMPKTMHRDASRRAEAEGISLNLWLLGSIARSLGGEKERNAVSDRYDELTRALDAIVGRLDRLDQRISRGYPSLAAIEEVTTTTVTKQQYALSSPAEGWFETGGPQEELPVSLLFSQLKSALDRQRHNREPVSNRETTGSLLTHEGRRRSRSDA